MQSDAAMCDAAAQHTAPKFQPPAASTLPLASSVRLWPDRVKAMLAAGEVVLVAGSNSSQVAVLEEAVTRPPQTSTLPVGSNTAFRERSRPTASGAISAQEPVAGE